MARLLRETFLLTRLELRLAYQQARGWLFVLAMAACATSAYIVYTRAHLVAFSPTAGLLGPRYFVASLGTHFLLLLSFGVALAGLDALHRNRQARVEEAFDARPLSGISVAAGRVIGWTLAIWLPAVCLGLLLQALGMVAEAYRWPFGGPMQLHSLLAYLFLALPPSLLLVGATANYVATATQNRATTALLLGALLTAACWVVLGRPPGVAGVVDAVANHGISGVSTVAPAFLRLVVDDLGEGFSVAHEGRPTILAGLLGLSAASQSIPDEGTALEPATARWRRVDLATAWGNEHRRTVTDIRAGDGRAQAVFEAVLPSPGRWRLAYHMPELVGEVMSTNSESYGRRADHGDYELLVSAASGTKAAEAEGVSVTFDAASAAKGWNRVGSFMADAGRVRVVVSNRSTGAVVYADAIRWIPADA